MSDDRLLDSSGRIALVSYGGGVQSTALLVLAATGHIDFRTFVFSNVGDDSEHPDTLRYIRDVAFDYAMSNGIDMHEIGRTPTKGKNAGRPTTLFGQAMANDSISIPIPVRMENGAPGRRSCTVDYKVRPVAKWSKDRGATADNPARLAIGISTDEIERATNNQRDNKHEQVEYPLLTLEHRLARYGANRDACKAIIADAGIPIPPKSSCFFCPFHRPTVFADMARTEPDLFERSAVLEDTLRARRLSRGDTPVFLTRYGRPLREVFANTQLAMLDDWDEDEGYRCGDRCDT